MEAARNLCSPFHLTATAHEIMELIMPNLVWRQIINIPRKSVQKVLNEGVFKSFRTGRLKRELQMVQLSATKCSCITILWVSLVSFAAIILCITSQRVLPKVRVYIVIYSVRKLLDTSSYLKETDCKEVNKTKSLRDRIQ
jgi:hypothetical protein